MQDDPTLPCPLSWILRRKCWGLGKGFGATGLPCGSQSWPVPPALGLCPLAILASVEVVGPRWELVATSPWLTLRGNFRVGFMFGIFSPLVFLLGSQFVLLPRSSPPYLFLCLLASESLPPYSHYFLHSMTSLVSPFLGVCDILPLLSPLSPPSVCLPMSLFL